jgi:hypothetical protein
MSKSIPEVRTWRAVFYALNGDRLGHVDVLAPTKFLARLGVRDALWSDVNAKAAFERCSKVSWGVLPKRKHKHVGVGWCPFCKHYGADCTGRR